MASLGFCHAAIIIDDAPAHFSPGFRCRQRKVLVCERREHISALNACCSHLQAVKYHVKGRRVFGHQLTTGEMKCELFISRPRVGNQRLRAVKQLEAGFHHELGFVE